MGSDRSYHARSCRRKPLHRAAGASTFISFLTNLPPPVAFPFCTVRFRLPKPPYPEALRTIGDHLRKRRLDLCLRQREVAELVGAKRQTLAGWETQGLRPASDLLPRVLEFVGYEPAAAIPPAELVRRLVAVRRRLRLARSE